MFGGRYWFGPGIWNFFDGWTVLILGVNTLGFGVLGPDHGFWGQNQGNLWGLKGSFFDLADRAHNCQTTRLIIANGSDDECLNISSDQGLLRPKIYLCVSASRKLTTNVLVLLQIDHKKRLMISRKIKRLIFVRQVLTKIDLLWRLINLRKRKMKKLMLWFVCVSCKIVRWFVENH